LIICIIGGEVESRRVHSRKSHHRSHHRQNPPKGVQSSNVVYQFLMGALAEISGAYSLIDGCSTIIPKWATEVADKEEAKSSIEDETKPMETTFDKILGYLGAAINFACSVKDKIIEFFSKRRIRYHRLFMQGKTRKRFNWSFTGFVSTVGGTISSVGSGIAAGARTLKDSVIEKVDWAKKKADDVIQYIKDKLEGLLKPILDFFDSLKVKFNAFLEKNPVLKIWFEFVKCFLKNDGIKAIKGLFETLSSFVSAIGALATPAGWVKLVINLVCGWEDLRDGINFLKLGFKEKAKPAKYNFYGRFIGKFMKAIAG